MNGIMETSILGIILVVSIKPGKWMITDIEELVGTSNTIPCVSSAVDTMLDLVKCVVYPI